MSINILKSDSKLNIAIRADGNNKIGLGHIIRSMVLGHEFKNNNCNVMYITRDYKETIDILEKNKFDILRIKTNASLGEEISMVEKILKANYIDIFIGDSFLIDKNYIFKLKKNDIFVAVIDNLRDMSLNVDLIINGGIYAYKLAEEAAKYNQKALLGTEYFLIRKQFLGSKKRIINKEVKNVLITMGGADPLNLTPKIISMVSSVDKNLKINVVLGNSFKNIKEIEKVSKKHSQVYLHYDVENMADIMYESDIAISAGGTTLYELAITGTPAIVFIQAENQVLQSTIFDSREIFINLGHGDKINELYFQKVFVELMDNYYKRVEMSKKGQTILDGKGPERCMEKIMYLYKQYSMKNQ